MSEEILKAKDDEILELFKMCNEKDKEIERLNNIIKEVREYIEENQEEHRFTDRGGFTYTEGHFLRDSDTLLEILDKENVKAIPPEVIGTNGEDGGLFDYGDKGDKENI